MPKEVAPRQGRRHNPLHDDLVENDSGNLRKIARSKRKEKHEKLESYVGSGLSKRILKIARDQQDELHEEEAKKTLHGVNSLDRLPKCDFRTRRKNPMRKSMRKLTLAKMILLRKSYAYRIFLPQA